MNKIKYSVKIQYLLLLITGLLIVSCSKEPNEQSNSIEETARISELLCANHTGDCDLTVGASSAVLEGDMVFSTEELLSYLNAPEEELVKHLAPDGSQYLERDVEVETRNRIQGFRSFVSQQEARDITYQILPSLRDVGGTCFDGWEQAVRDAAQSYNNLAGVKLNFREITRNELPNIIIGCDNDPFFNTSIDTRNSLFNISSVGRARLPLNRRPGKYISINNTSNSSRKKGIMIHEFGHTLGFKHTDTSDGVEVKCGGKYEYTYDPNNSIFRGTVNRDNLHGTDIRSIRHLWPDNLEQPVDGTVERLSNSWIKFKFRNPSNSSKPYAEIVLAHSLNDRWEVARFWCDAPNHRGEYEILWYAPDLFTSGSQHFWVKGVSHAEEEGSNWCDLGGFVR